MSDEARDLLIYGVAAAKATSRDEARNYLEWVLRTDADYEQQAEAWYWLSTITDDPAEKRSCLENSLAAMPNFPESRRDLAILDGRLKVGDLHDPRFDVEPVVPPVGLQQGDLVLYKCPGCGARLSADGLTGSLVCSFCGYRAQQALSGDIAPQVLAQSPASRVKEQDWDAAIFSTAGHRWEVPTARTFKCESCGASVIVPAGHVSTACPFCGTPHVVQSEAEHELMAPTALLPFRLSAQDAFSAVVGWLKSAHFAPDDLSRTATQVLPHPVYLPAWTFDLSGDLRWRGYTVKSEYRTVTRVPASGNVPIFHDDIIVPATSSLPKELIGQLNFELHDLVPYSVDALANWPAEIYSISPADASIEARGQALEGMKSANLIAESGSNALVEDLTVDSSDVAVLSYKLVLLPVWIGSYTYSGQVYHVIVNGHSGTVAGDVPRTLLQRVLSHFLG